MFTAMRRKEKLMSDEDAIKVLTEAEYGTLATIGENGYPYSVPLNYAYTEGVIYFHSAPTGNKIVNITTNNKTSFSVVSYCKLLTDRFDTEYDSVIVFGNARVIQDEPEKRRALTALIDKYSADYREQGIAYIDRAINGVIVCKLEITHMTGKRGR